ncbi:MAG: secretin N-terminal domain-containing protein [Rhabdochlamydiaceae bacterium]
MGFSIFQEKKPVIEEAPNPTTQDPNSNEVKESSDGFVINYNNISMNEYLRYVSKMLNVNFVFNEDDINFNVTIVSEEPVSAQNILSTLVQVLRVHRLSLVEEGDTLIISKNPEVNQIPAIADPNSTETGHSLLGTPMITRVFKVNHTSVGSLASILKPMSSAQAIIEILPETQQLIVTDITTNVDKIAILIDNLDTPNNHLEIGTFFVRNIAISEMIELVTKIITPIAQSHPFVLVPQVETNSIFIVSTKHLIEKTKNVMNDLDKSSFDVQRNNQQTIFVYNIIYKRGDELLHELFKIAQDLQQQNNSQGRLGQALTSAKWIKNSNSLLFTADDATLAKIKEILVSLDIQPLSETFIFPVKNGNHKALQDALMQMSKTLSEHGIGDSNLIQAIGSSQWISDANSLVFSGDPQSLNKIRSFLEVFDNKSDLTHSSVGFTFKLFHLSKVKGNKVIEHLLKVADHLSQSSYPNKELIQAIRQTKWESENNSLILTGTKNALEELVPIIEKFDTDEYQTPEKSSFFIYKPIHKAPKEVEASLQELVHDLDISGVIDSEILESVSGVKYIPLTNSLVFTGSNKTINAIKDLLSSLDVPSEEPTKVQHLGNITFLIYKIKHTSSQQILNCLKSFSLDLQKHPAVDAEIINIIDKVEWLKETNSLLFSGTQHGLEKIEKLVEKLDTLEAPSSILPDVTKLQNGESMSFAIYKPHYRKGEELIELLQEFKQNLSHSGIQDNCLFTSINQLKWIPSTSSILVSGFNSAIDKVQELLQRFDVTEHAQGPLNTIDSIDNTSFLVYKLQYHKGEEICTALKQVAQQILKTPTQTNKNLSDAINSIQWIGITNSLLVTGEQEILSRLRELIQNLDVPLRQVFIEVLIIETTMNNSQQFGLQWGGKLQYLNKIAAGTGLTPPANPANGYPTFPTQGSPFYNNYNGIAPPGVTPNAASAFPLPTSGFDFGVIGDIIMHKGKSFLTLGSLLNALQTDTDSTIVMNPKIITQDNNVSTIFIGQNLPYNASVTNVAGNAGVTQTGNIQYRDIGFNLTITPVLGNNDVVTLDISTDMTSLIQNLNTNNNSNFNINGIATSHASMKTKVHVPNDNFLVLSGMLQESKSRFKSQIPCLGGLPFIGAAFSEKDRATNKDNIIIFVKPHIVNSYEEYRQITEHQQTLHQESAQTKILKEEFAAGIDMVKIEDLEP